MEINCLICGSKLIPIMGILPSMCVALECPICNKRWSPCLEGMLYEYIRDSLLPRIAALENK
jgi:hypothetical protein